MLYNMQMNRYRLKMKGLRYEQICLFRKKLYL